jgi:hypothetical protein
MSTTMMGMVITLLAATIAHAQVEPRFDGRNLDAETRREVEAMISAARLAGLPVEPLVDKAFEGSEKVLPGPGGRALIVAAVRKRWDFLAAANQVLKPATQGEIAAGAEVLSVGFANATLTRLRSEHPFGELTVSLGVLVDLTRRGVPRDTAAAIVVALARGGARDSDFKSFWRDVERDIAIGINPAAAATTRATGLTGTMDLDAGPAQNRGPTGTSRQIPPERP